MEQTIIKNDRYYEEGCPDCGNTKKINSFIQKNDAMYTTLLEKIEILNSNIPELFKIINEHKIAIASLNQTTNTIVSDFKLLEQRNTEDHRQIHSKINRDLDGTKKDLKEEFNGKIDKLDTRQFELVKEVNQSIGKKTLTPIIISVISLILMAITAIVTYIK